MTQQERPRARRVWGYIRLALMIVLIVILITQIVRADWTDVVITAVFVALLGFLEAMDRGLIRGPGGGEPPGSR
ncbi:MAG: hypothetical protein F4Z77_06680 [Dehalococcoidia bacterium]|nr:hypothetical protein [Dehalococcoidia bacterium]MYA54065.1 hypothetical protein [Dehalococcoidia bacterium]